MNKFKYIKLIVHPIIIFCLIAIVLRFFSFSRSVINHDESTYLVIANEMLHGKILYTDVIDIKPAGIFLTVAAIQSIFGKSVFIFRLITAVLIGITAFFLYKVKLRIGYSKSAGWAAGILYIIMISIYTYYGISVNTEHFFNFFTILALWFILKNKPGYYFIAGLSMGIGFTIKYFVVADFGAFMLFLLLFNRKKFSGNWGSILKCCLGFIIPFGLLNLYYYSIGKYADFYFITFVAPGRYPVDRTLCGSLKFILDFHLRYLPVMFFFYYSLINKKYRSISNINEQLLVIIWSVFILIIISLSGKPFGHYFIQLMIPVSLMTATFYDYRVKMNPIINSLRNKYVVWTILIILSCVIVLTQKKDYFDKTDTPKKVANYIAPKLSDEDNIYTTFYHHIIYLLLDKRSPTKYVHRSLLYADHHIYALKINLDKEFENIIHSNPKFFINTQTNFPPELNDFVQQNYTIDKVFEEKKYNVYVYKRKD